MNRRTFLFGSAMTCGAIPLANPSAWAARLPVSTVTVTILSITRESLNREAAPVRGVTFETSTFVAKARVVEVPHNEHGLTAGDVIDIHYKDVVRQPPDPNF